MNQNNNLVGAVSAAALLVVALLLTACSDSKEERANKPQTQQSSAPGPVFDHAHGNEVSDLVKHKFEHDFAEQCIDREMASPVNKELDRERFAKPCMCIAQHLMKGLTAKEAELFLNEHKNTQSLRIRYEAAAYDCLQKAAQGQQNQAPVIISK
jgi:hypothetical protein